MNPLRPGLDPGPGARWARSLRRVLAGLFLTLAAGLPVAAQAPDPGSWKGNVDFGFDTSGGNKSLTILRGGFAVTYLRTDRAEFEVSGNLR